MLKIFDIQENYEIWQCKWQEIKDHLTGNSEHHVLISISELEELIVIA